MDNTIYMNTGMSFTHPSPEEISRLFRETHSIAIVGLPPNVARSSFQVAKRLQSKGYRIIPVRPIIESVLGEQSFPDLENLPELPDIVDVFRAPKFVPDLVDSCINLGVQKLWLQDGIIHEEAAQRVHNAGITVVMNRCMWRDAHHLEALAT